MCLLVLRMQLPHLLAALICLSVHSTWTRGAERLAIAAIGFSNGCEPRSDVSDKHCCRPRCHASNSLSCQQRHCKPKSSPSRFLQCCEWIWLGSGRIHSKCAWSPHSSSTSPVTAVHRPEHNSSAEGEPLPADYIHRLIQQHQSWSAAGSFHRGPGQASMVHSKHVILYMVSDLHSDWHAQAWQH